MNGAESLIQTAIDSGVEVCFANPGTTEMPFVAALDQAKGMRSVLGLFEGVCTGAADGYARMADKPAMTVLHLGPGFANGIANLHNARRARTPVVNVIGNHATWHLPYDAPLTSDIVSLATPVSGWVHETSSAEDVPHDMARAIAASMSPPGQVASLIVPHDLQLAQVEQSAKVGDALAPVSVPQDRVEVAAQALQKSAAPALFLGGKALREDTIYQAGRIAQVTGCKIIAETLFGRVDRRPGLPTLQRLPYYPQAAMKVLSAFQTLVFVGARQPVTFFGYEGVPSIMLTHEQDAIMLANPEDDLLATLTQLADALGAPVDVTFDTGRAVPDTPTGDLTPDRIAASIVHCAPEGTIIVDEGVTTSNPLFDMANEARPHTILRITGGAIGFGIPGATGASIACPDRPVINIQADGSAMYTLQALWTQARENLNITTLICNNRRYNILQYELKNAGFETLGEGMRQLTEFNDPPIDWQQIAGSFGIPAMRVEKAEDLTKAMQQSVNEAGPKLIEMVL